MNGEWLQLLVTIAGVVLPTAAGIVKYLNGRIDTNEARAVERAHALRNDIQQVKNDLQTHELHVAQNHPNLARLGEALKPVEAAVARVEGTLERLFTELKGKADKAGND